MAKYLKLFSAHTEYEDWKYNSDEYVTPNVSMCEQENELHYNPIPHYARLYNGNTLLQENKIYFQRGCENEYASPGYGECEDYCCQINFYTWDDNTSQFLPFDSFELVMPGCTDVTVEIANREAQFTYSVVGNIVKVVSTEGPWNGFYSFGVGYTCNGVNCGSSVVINYPD